MNDPELRRALRELPVPRARDSFTREVLGRLDRAAANREESPLRGPGRNRLLAAAAALALALGAAAGWRIDAGADRRAEIQALRAESTRLRGEIRDLETRLQEPTTLLYVGGTESVDLVLDLSRFPGPVPGEAAASGFPSEPASGGVL